jgi:hypothetical protein
MPEMVQITGRVADIDSGITVPDVQVEAWDTESPGHRVLGSAATDAGGGFTLEFEREDEDAMLALPRIDVERPDDEPPGVPDEVPWPRRPRVPRPVFLKVLRAGDVLAASGSAAWDGRPEVALMVDAGRAPSPPPGRPGPASTRPAEVTITELGEALAATAASIQQELTHYPTENGAFFLEDLDVEIPVGFGVDTLGQLRVRMADEAEATSGRLRLRVKPLVDARGPRSATAPQPIESLGVLEPEVIERLQAERVYSVGDLLRVSRNAAGAQALEHLGVADVPTVRTRAEVVALPSLPPVVAESLLAAGIEEPRAFVDADPTDLAGRLRDQLGEPLSPKDVAAWQASTRPLVMLGRRGDAARE